MFKFNEEQKMLQTAVKEVVTKLIEPCAGKRNKEKVYPADIIQSLKDLGYYALVIPEKWSGTGMDAVSSMIVVNEIARSDASIAQSVAVSNFAYLYPMFACATDEQKKSFVLPCTENGKIGALAVNEPDGTSGPLQTVARQEGDFYILNGTKTMLSNINVSDYALVYAKTDEASMGFMGNSAFVVNLKETQGITLTKEEDTLGLHSLKVGGVKFDNVKIPQSSLIGPKDQGFIVIGKTLELMTISNSAVALGIAERAYIEAVNYTKVRCVNGKPMCKMEAIQLEIADIKMKLAWLRLIVFHTAHLFDVQDPKVGHYLSVTKNIVTETAKEICDRALQIFGGYGYMEGYVVERLYRDIRAFTIIGCTTEVHKSVIAQGIYTSEGPISDPWE